MQNDSYSEIKNLVSTKDDLNLINSELDLLTAGLYETKGKTFDYVLKNLVSDNFALIVSKLLESDTKENVIKKIKETLAQIKFIELTMAIDPTQSFLSKISDYLTSSLNQKVAIDLKVDQKIIGGVKVMYDGKYYDGSLKSKLDKILINYV